MSLEQRVATRILQNWFFLAGVAGLLVVVPPRGPLSAQEIRSQVRPADPAENYLGAPRESGTAALSGRAVDARTGTPVAGATVSLTRRDVSGAVETARCDSQGRFVFINLPASQRYALEGTHTGYRSAYFGQASPDRASVLDPIEFAITDGEWRSDAKISLWPGSSISGRVTDERGEPLIGVAVRPFIAVTLGGQRYFAGLAPTTTDDRGVYQLSMLGPATYWVGIANPMVTVPSSLPEIPPRRPVGTLYTTGPPDGGDPAVAGSALTTRDRTHRLVANPLSMAPPEVLGPVRSYHPVFYPSAPTPDLAQSITLEAGADRSGVDFALQPVAGHTVKGRTSSPPASGPFPLLRLMRRGFEHLGLGNEVATSVLERDGSFTFLGVPAGDYTITAQSVVSELMSGSPTSRLPPPAGSPDGGTGSNRIAGAPNVFVSSRQSRSTGAWIRSSLSVPDADVEGLSIPLSSTVSIRGRIEGDAGVRLGDGRRFLVTAEPADGDPSYGSSIAESEPGPRVPVAFSLDGLLPGRYLLRASGFPVSAVTWQGRDVTDIGIDASSGDATDVVITLTSQTNELQGIVTGRDKSAGSLMVLVFPTSESGWSSLGWTPRRARTASVRGDGSFSFQKLPAGEYFVVAVNESLTWSTPEVLRRLAGLAVRTTIAWGQKTSVDVPFRSQVLR